MQHFSNGETQQKTEKVTNILRHALNVEYRYIFYYPRLEKLMPDKEIADKLKFLGEASVRHADIVFRAIISLGGAPTFPTLESLPDPLDLKDLFRTQVEYEKLSLWLYQQAVALVPVGFDSSSLRKIAEEEVWHVRMAEEILRRLKQPHPIEALCR